MSTPKARVLARFPEAKATRGDHGWEVWTSLHGIKARLGVGTTPNTAWADAATREADTPTEGPGLAPALAPVQPMPAPDVAPIAPPDAPQRETRPTMPEAAPVVVAPKPHMLPEARRGQTPTPAAPRLMATAPAAPRLPNGLAALGPIAAQQAQIMRQCVTEARKAWDQVRGLDGRAASERLKPGDGLADVARAVLAVAPKGLAAPMLANWPQGERLPSVLAGTLCTVASRHMGRHLEPHEVGALMGHVGAVAGGM